MTTQQKAMTVQEVNQAYGQVVAKLAGMTALVKSLSVSYPGMGTSLKAYVHAAEEIMDSNPSIFVPLPNANPKDKVLVGIR